MSEQNQQRSREEVRHEYAEAIQTIRHYGNLRMALFSIFFAVIGGVGLVSFGKDQFAFHAAIFARLAGFLVIATFWTYIVRLSQLFNHFVSMAVELEQSLGYSQWTRRPIPKYAVVRTDILFRLFFCLLTALWTYAVLAIPLSR